MVDILQEGKNYCEVLTFLLLSYPFFLKKYPFFKKNTQMSTGTMKAEMSSMCILKIETSSKSRNSTLTP